MIINKLKFKDGSLIEKVAQKLLVEHKDKETIITELKTELNENEVSIRKKVNDNLWLINQKLIKINERAVISSESEVVESETLSNNIGEHCLFMEIREKRGKMLLYVKTNNEFEGYVKRKKEIKHTLNFWNKGVEGDFYYGSLVGNSEFDDINKEVILFNSINYGIFRAVGISQGIEFEINKLVSVERLVELLEKLSNDFVAFYNKNILKQKTAISVIVDDGVNNENH